MDREAIYEELRRVRVTFRRLVEEASPDELARASSGTRWTNQQLLYHMLFGYLVTQALDFMTLADIYHYPTQHFDFHQRQLTLGQPAAKDTAETP